MPGSSDDRDDFFLAEFGSGELSSRLWRGGLRARTNGYSCQNGPRALANALKDGLDVRVTDGTAESLINEIETCWNDAGRMRRACQAIGEPDCRQSVALSVSLAKLVLSIDIFQPAMVTCIVNKISEFGEESSSESDIAKMLLNQLRWLDFIVDGPALCETLLSIIPVVSAPIQRSLIEALPEILDDSAREAAVSELVRLLGDSPTLMGSVVDALSSLGVDDARLMDVHSSILTTLAAANRDTLPVSLRYLLRTCPQSLYAATVKAIRHTLALPSLGPGPGKLCFDALRSGLRMRKALADHVIKALRSIDKPSDHRPADFWILLALFDSPLHRKSAEMLLRKKGAKNAMSRVLMDAALAPFADAFGSLTDNLVEMASVSLKAPELGARRTGVLLYALLFKLFPDGNARRKVVMSLLDHTGTRRPSEVDAALSAFVSIAQEGEKSRSLLPHSASVEGLLDFLESFSDSQLRQIWEILGYLCRASSSKGRRGEASDSDTPTEIANRQGVGDDSTEMDAAGESELATIEILLRKELTHSSGFYRRIGVLGACTMIKVLSNVVKSNILKMLLDIGRVHPFSQALAFDELAQVFGGKEDGAKETADAIRKTISALFEKKYIADRAGLGTFTKEEDLLSAEFFGNLEGEDFEFCFSISAHVRDEKTLKASQDAVRGMVPNLRLLCVMTASRYDGSLSEIDAIIGAPLHLPLMPSDGDVGSLSAHAKGDLLLSLFIAHGWIVELLNGFGEQEGTEIRAKCMKRVDNLLALKSQICSCVTQIPLWREVLFDAYNGTRARRLGAVGQKIGKGPRGSRVPRVCTLGEPGGIAKGSEWLSLSRQLEAPALSLLRITSPITWRLTETETELPREGEPTTETVALSPQALLFLLSELAVHVDAIVGSDVRRPGAFGLLLFRAPGGSGLSGAGIKKRLDETTDASLRKLKGLRGSLTALGSQLTRCVKKIFPVEHDDLAEDDATLELYRRCTQLCLHSLAGSLNSRILDDPLAEEFLFTVLASIRLDESPRVEASDPFTSADVHIAAREAFAQLRRTLQQMMSADCSDEEVGMNAGCAAQVGLHTCCAFLGVMDCVFAHCSEKDRTVLGAKFSESALWVLNHPWDAATLRTAKTQRLIPGIVKLYVQHATEPFSVVERLREQVVKLTEKQAGLNKKDITSQDINASLESESKIASMTEQTFNAFTVATVEQYLWMFKSFDPRGVEDPEAAFARMESFIKAELPLYTIARRNQRMLGPIMRAGRTFVDIFLKTCLPFLKEHFSEHRSSVVQICKIHQKPTRILQTFCAHSKRTRDTSLTGLVPPLRKSLELLLYRVKDLLHTNNATDAFQLGNLKHRDINGEVLSSQHLQYKSESEDESQYGSDLPQEPQEDDKNDRDSRTNGRSQAIPGRSTKRPRSAASHKKREDWKEKPRKSRKKSRQTKTNANTNRRESQRESARPNLDFGSDAESDASKAEELPAIEADVHRDSDKENEDQNIIPKGPKRKRRRVVDDEDDIGRRNPLIDDEAGASGDDDEDDEGADLSQFLVFGDEEED